MSFKKNFFKNISTYAVYSYASQGLEFLSTIILSRLLLPGEYGLVAIIVIFSGFIQIFSTLGIGSSIIRSDYGYTFHKHLFSLAVWLGFALTIILMLLSWPISFFFDNNLLILPTILISFKFFSDSFTYVPYALLSKRMQFNAIGMGRLLRAVFQIGFTILLAFAGFSYWSLVIPLIFGPFLEYLYYRNKVEVKFRLYGWRATMRIAWKIRSLMGNLSLNNLINYWAGNVDKVVIGKLYTDADLGLYNRAFRFISMTNRLIVKIFGTVLFPSLKNLLNEKGNAQKEYLDILRIITLFNIPVMALLVLLPDTLVFYLWGEDWMGVAGFLPYVGIILIYNSMVATMGSLYLLFEKEKYLLLSNFIRSTITIAIIIIAGFFSMMHIIKFITLSYILVTIPINMYFGFYKSFGYNVKEILVFWLPFIFFGLVLFLMIYLEFYFFQWILMLLFLIILFYPMKGYWMSSLKYVRKKFLIK